MNPFGRRRHVPQKLLSRRTLPSSSAPFCRPKRNSVGAKDNPIRAIYGSDRGAATNLASRRARCAAGAAMLLRRFQSDRIYPLLQRQAEGIPAPLKVCGQYHRSFEGRRKESLPLRRHADSITAPLRAGEPNPSPSVSALLHRNSFFLFRLLSLDKTRLSLPLMQMHSAGTRFSAPDFSGIFI